MRSVAKMKIISRIGIIGSGLIIGIMLLLSYYGNNVGSFTVTVNADIDREASIAVSENGDFSNNYARLVATQASDLDCLGNQYDSDSKDDLPDEIVAALEDIRYGAQNREGYFCYTFYIKNTGTYVVDYSMTLNIVTVKENTDSAARILLNWDRDIENPHTNFPLIRTVYAKVQGTKEGQTPGELDFCSDEKFLSSSTILTKSREYFQIGSVDRVTVIMWIHGWDLDAIDDIKSGRLRLSMDVSVTNLID